MGAPTKATLAWLDEERPKTRGECQGKERPCPWAMCRFHMMLTVNPKTGSIQFSYPDKELWEIPETCALDLAERGGLTLKEMGKLLNVTRERARQLVEKAVASLGEKLADTDLK